MVMSILASSYGLMQSYNNHEEVVGAIANITCKTKEEFVKENIIELAHGNVTALLDIRQELIYRGEIILVEQINGLIDTDFKISQESCYILKLYLNSKQFHEDLSNL